MQSKFFLRLEEWHDHSRSSRYQKCAGERLAETQVTVSRAIHVLSTEDQPRQLVSQRDRTCRNLESEEKPAFSWVLGDQKFVERQRPVPAQQKAAQWWGLQG
jgi:hypothetical protein